MAYEELCMYCFEDRGGESICPHCGRDSRAAVPQIQMLPGSLVYHDRFLVGRALGQDATGIVYAAFDTKRENKLRLREYLPRDCAERLPDGSVVPIAGMEDQFDKGLKKLRASVEGVEDPKKRHFFFEENGTAYIAQRKSAAAATSRHEREEEDDDEDRSSLKRVGIIVGVCAVLVIVAAIIIISLVNGALNSADDVTQNPTLNPTGAWAPAETPTPTPYVSPTFAALVDPEQSWMDYKYEGDVNQEFQQQQNAASRPTATPKPTINTGTGSSYTTISSKSSAAEITSLQQRLVTLGWLDYTGITGAYDSATKQAVKNFQTHVNDTVRPAEQLSVDGIAGPKTLQWLYGAELTRPTPQPTPMVTPDPVQSENVDKNSSKNDIRAVQRKLIFLGLMESGSDDGVYGTTTTAAVKKFQQRVNQIEGFEIIEVSGVVDPLTMAYLNFYVADWEDKLKATPTPAPAVTPSPTPAPTAAPTDAPDKEEGGQTVDQSSPKESIQFVQQMLIGVGLLPEGADDGVYGSATVAAVAKFQEWFNNQTGSNALSVTGTADALTLSYLESMYSNGMVVAPTAQPTDAPLPPTAEPTDAPLPPTAEPTDAPDVPEDNVSVGPDSPKESVQFVQQMLIEIGLLGDGSDDGVYGSGTSNAVRAFQQAVNDRLGANTLPVTGLCDQLTLSYLEEFASSGTNLAPTAEPTAQPTQAPEAGLTLNVNGAPAAGVVEVTGDSIAFDWSATGNIDSYYIYVTDSSGSPFYTEEATSITNGVFPRNALTPGAVYTIRIGALPSGGDQDDMIWAEAQFTVPAAATEPPASLEVQLAVNGSQSDGVIEVSGSSVAFQWAASGSVSGYTVNVTDPDGATVFTADLNDTEGTLSADLFVPGQTYTFSVGAIPAGGGETVWARAQFAFAAAPTPEPTPAVGTVDGLTLSINGSASDGVVEITGDSVSFAWNASGSVSGYTVRVTDPDGATVFTTDLTDTQGTLSAGMFTPGKTYTFSVGAIPTGGSAADAVWTSGQFAVPVPVTPEPTAAPTVAPVSKPGISIDGTAQNIDGVPYLTGDKAIFTWTSEGSLQGYRVYITNSAGARRDLGDVTDTSWTISLSDLAPDVYTIQVGAVPMGARNEDDIVWSSFTFGIPSGQPTEAPESTDAPSNWPTTLSAASSEDDIKSVQAKLYMLKLIPNTGSIIPGTLDETTLAAIVSFQQLMNADFGANLPVIDPTNPDLVVDSETLAMLQQITPDMLTPAE